MHKKLLFSFLCIPFTFLYATQNISFPLFINSSVVANDENYFTYEKDNVEIIYSSENITHAKNVAKIGKKLHASYENLFDWKLDEKLYVGLISSNNQIANGFSTQWPNNRQINYLGGSMMVDYFSTTSWIDTLIYHETAHNYQINVKGSMFSRGLHSLFGNGSVLLPMPLTVPNIAENSFMLEGNAVLNESWHGNGGRLYSGRFKAQTILQAKAGNIIASDVYNSKLTFPYGERYYIQGGFYNLYLAEKYGLKNVNHYFKFHSEDFLWPQFTNASMKQAIGIDFEDSLNAFANEYKKLSKNFVEATGKHYFSSQFFNSLSHSKKEICFIINEDGVSQPELVVVNKKKVSADKFQDSWSSGKVIKVDGEYFTQASRNISASKIVQGLFNSDGFVRDETESKVVQGYLSDGRTVYFDVLSSFSQPQLYVGNHFYAQVNSSVIIDSKDNIYYFVQNGKKRILYKNKTPLLSFVGFYSIVSDIDSKGTIYFVANSKLGSTLYRFKNQKVTRASRADNVVEARLMNDNQVLIAAISDKDYYYVFNSLKNIKQTPYVTKLFFEDNNYYARVKEHKINFKLEQQEYTPLFNMHYSGSNLEYGSNVNGESIGKLQANFEDPLSQNSASLFIQKDDLTVTLAGIEYANAEYLVNYTLGAYGLLDEGDLSRTRSSGVMAGASLPFYQKGYYYGAFGLSYFQDYEKFSREPLGATLTFLREEKYGISMYSNYVNALQLYYVNDRGDNMVGENYTFKHDLNSEIYIGLEQKYSLMLDEITVGGRGVKITNNEYQKDMDISAINIRSLDSTLYVKSAGYGEVNIAKVLNFSSYFFTFPFSLQRESIYAKYRYYDISDFKDTKFSANEITTGITLSTVMLNSFELPMSFEYIFNDALFIRDSSKFRFLIKSSF